MPVEIDEEGKARTKFLFQIAGQCLYCFYLGNNQSFLTSKHSIQISPSQTGSEVAQYNSIWIYHRDHFKYYDLSEVFCLFILRADELEKSFDHIAATCLSRVYARCH